MKKFKFTIGGTQYDVEVLDLEGNSVEIEVNGTKYTVEIEKEVKKVVTKTPILVRSGVPEPTRSDKKIKKVIAAKGNQVLSPLPGAITHVFVKEGDEVKVGQKLLAMEAMKMENDVLAEKEGVVSSIKVRVGDAVLQGDVLIEM